MTFWLREVAGWLLIVLGLASFGEAYLFASAKRVFTAGPLVVIGFVLFRGGLHLIKVATAVRASQEAVPATAQRTVRRVGKARTNPVKPKRSVIPGTNGTRQAAEAE